MRGFVPEYEVRAPKSLAEALRLFSDEPGEWRPLAGGTDLMVLLEQGVLVHRKFVSLPHLAELRGIQETPDRLVIGGMTTFAEIYAHPGISTLFPNLAHAGRQLGALAIQNRATIAGNVGNASPAADSPPSLLSYDAEIQLVSSQGNRWVPYRSFHTGYKRTELREDEIIAAVALPKTLASDAKHYYRKVGTRKAQAISKVCLAAVATLKKGKFDHVRISLGSVAPTVLRCPKTETFLQGQTPSTETAARAVGKLLEEIKPISDIRSTAEYRNKVAANLVTEFIESCREAK